jgi:hypothetical protein
MDFNVIALCGAGEDADEDLTQPRRGPEQEAPLESSGGDLDQGAVGNEAQTAAHATINGKAPDKLASLHPGNACGTYPGRLVAEPRRPPVSLYGQTGNPLVSCSGANGVPCAF